MTRKTTTIACGATAAGLLMAALPATAAAAEAAPAEQQGLLDFSPAAAVWVLGIFLAVVVILSRTAWKNVLAGLNAREARIRRDIADAEAARVKAEGSLVEYNKQLATAEGQVRELLARAAADAERIAANITAKAQADATEIKDRATREIEANKQQALAEIYEQTADLATSVAEKILRREIRVSDQKTLVDQTLRQMQAV